MDSENAGESASILADNFLSPNHLRFTAWPMADDALSQEILDLLQQGTHYRQVKKGANESKLSRLPLLSISLTESFLFSHQVGQPRYLRDHRARRRHHPSGHRHAPAPARRGQERPLRFRPEQDLAGPCLWCEPPYHCGQHQLERGQ